MVCHDRIRSMFVHVVWAVSFLKHTNKEINQSLVHLCGFLPFVIFDVIPIRLTSKWSVLKCLSGVKKTKKKNYVNSDVHIFLILIFSNDT